jgi:hypothetical protein
MEPHQNDGYWFTYLKFLNLFSPEQGQLHLPDVRGLLLSLRNSAEFRGIPRLGIPYNSAE